jgi:tetrahydromethanopterin S-methyltransferase subunit G
MSKQVTNEDLAVMIKSGFDIIDENFQAVDKRFDKFEDKVDIIQGKLDKALIKRWTG